MTCTPCTCSPAPEADCSLISSSDTLPLWPSSGMPTAAKCSESAQPMDGSVVCACTNAMCDCLIHPSTPAAWIASMRDSLAKTFQRLGSEQASEKERAADFIAKCSELPMRFDRATSSWKTSQQSLLPDSAQSLETWPRAGMTVDGRAYQHRQPVPRTTVIGGGALQSVPTPTVNGNYNRKGASKTSGDGLATWAKMWQTPVADDPCNRKEGKWNSRGEPKLSAQVKMWPTPVAHDDGKTPEAHMAMKARMKGGPRHTCTSLTVMVKGIEARMWPTPTAAASKGSCPKALTRANGRSRVNDRIDYAIMASDGGLLNPTWVEWLMGWPLGHTASAHWATAKSRSKPQPLGDCSEGLE